MASKGKVLSNRFEHIVELANEGILTLDIDGHIDYINERGAAILGYRPEEMIGRRPSEFLLPEDKDEVRGEGGQAGTEHIEVPARRKDGSALWVSLSITPILDQAYQGSVGIFSDITDRKLAEDVSAFQAHLLASVHDAIIAVDNNFKVVYWNEMAERMFGWTAEEVFGTHAGDILRPEIPRSTREKAIATTLNEGFYDGETICHHKDGHEMVIEAHTSLRRDSRGRVLQLVASLRDVSDRKRAAEALRRSEEEYRHLVQYAPTAIFELDFVHMRFKRVNDAMSELTGYSREELLSMDPLDFLDEDERERFRGGITERLSGLRRNGMTEYRVRAKGGRELWAVFTLKPIYENGKVTGALVIGHDDTERREIREELKRTEQRFRTILEHSRDGIYMLDLRTDRFLFVSPSQVELVGFTLEELNQMNPHQILERVHREDRASLIEAQRLVMQEQDPGETVHRWKVKSGEYRWFSDRRRIVRDEKGRPIAIVGTSRDVTDRICREQALRSSEERLSLALSAGHLGTWDWIIETGMTVWNNEAYRMLGYAVGEVRPSFSNWVDRIYPEDRDKVQGTLERAFREGGEYTSEFRVVWPDGSHHWIYAVGGIELDQRHRPVRTFGVMMDVTERKNVERELERYAEELERSNAELQQFAYVASHDLQEPLRMVILYLELLNKRHGVELSPESIEYMNIALEGAERMRQLVNDLLEYSRVETKVREFAPVDMNEVASSVRDSLRVAIDEACADVRIEELPTVMADEAQMKQLLQNLIANAIKFQDDRKPVVDVYACDSESEWMFAIEDNGIGIDPRYQDKLFKMFYRLTSREEYPGTGIGLAICKKIVERHGGRIWVESDGRSGSTFIFTLPKSDQDQGQRTTCVL